MCAAKKSYITQKRFVSQDGPATYHRNKNVPDHTDLLLTKCGRKRSVVNAILKLGMCSLGRWYPGLHGSDEGAGRVFKSSFLRGYYFEEVNNGLHFLLVLQQRTQLWVGIGAETVQASAATRRTTPTWDNTILASSRWALRIAGAIG